MAPSIMHDGDVSLAASLSIDVLTQVLSRDWSVRAGDLEWSCRRTLDHIIDVLALYASAVALPVQSRDEWIPTRNGDPDAGIAELLQVLRRGAAVLEKVFNASPPSARAFHPSGMSDADGFRAMACSEILTHTDDILLAFGTAAAFKPQSDLCERILRRVFPWAPDTRECPDRWLAVKWSCGRVELPGYPRLDDRWWWFSAPIAEWDGTRNERTAPPAWN